LKADPPDVLKTSNMKILSYSRWQDAPSSASAVQDLRKGFKNGNMKQVKRVTVKIKYEYPVECTVAIQGKFYRKQNYQAARSGNWYFVKYQGIDHNYQVPMNIKTFTDHFNHLPQYCKCRDNDTAFIYKPAPSNPLVIELYDQKFRLVLEFDYNDFHNRFVEITKKMYKQTFIQKRFDL